MDFETKDDETDHPDKGDSEGDNNTENNAKDDSTRQIQISQKRMILKILERMPETLIKKEQTKIPPDPTKQMKKSPKQKMRIKTQDLTMKQKIMKQKIQTKMKTRIRNSLIQIKMKTLLKIRNKAML